MVISTGLFTSMESVILTTLLSNAVAPASSYVSPFSTVIVASPTSVITGGVISMTFTTDDKVDSFPLPSTAFTVNE